MTFPRLSFIVSVVILELIGYISLIPKPTSHKKRERQKKVFGTLNLFVFLMETEIKYPILQGGILTF